ACQVRPRLCDGHVSAGETRAAWAHVSIFVEFGLKNRNSGNDEDDERGHLEQRPRSGPCRESLIQVAEFLLREDTFSQTEEVPGRSDRREDVTDCEDGCHSNPGHRTTGDISPLEESRCRRPC